MRSSLALAALWPVSALAATPPRVLGQNATVMASGDTVLISRLPVVTASGATVYRDVTLTVAATDTGDVSVAAAKGIPTLDVPPVNAFRAGLYEAVNPAGKPFLVRVSGPSVGPGGVSVWSLAADPNGDHCSAPLAATWYAGPVEANPLKPRLAGFKMVSPLNSYGTLGGMPCGSYNWPLGGTIAAQQTGNGLTMASLGPDGMPVASISWRLVPGQ